MKKVIICIVAGLLLAACGGETLTKQSSSSSGSSSSSSDATAQVAAVNVLVSSPQLASNDSAPITVTALVLNAVNQTMANQPVVITTNSGYLTNTQVVTSANGTATATLHTADPTNRTITISAVSGGITSTVTASVVGTRLTISGSGAMVLGDAADYSITLVDSGGNGLASKTVTVTSAKNNTLSAATLLTDTNGKATVHVTGTVAGSDVLTATALGLTAAQSISVTNDSFAFTAPTANPILDIPLNSSVTAKVTWTISGVSQVAKPITFSSTRGQLTVLLPDCVTPSGSAAASVVATTSSAGQACVLISSTNAGPATINATTTSGSTTQVAVNFVATTSAAINVQANPATVSAAGGQSTVSAIVRDANNNLVKGKVVSFNLTDSSGGSLSVASALTDSEGKAQTVYTSSSSPSATNGVIVTATVSDNPSVTGTATLTVAQRALFISMGTGNTVNPKNAAQYSVDYAIQVTDANGNGVAGVALTVRVNSLWYGTGTRCYDGTSWVVGVVVNNVCTPGYIDVCTDEDSLLGSSSPYYRNGVLDQGEDFNHDGILEAGNIATVSPTAVTTDASGFALVQVAYPKDHAYWVKVELSASTTVAGTESSRITSFQLPGLADDFSDSKVAPPGQISPFGVQNHGCTTPTSFP